MTKEEILSEIRRTAKENGGIPLGRVRFMQATGIRDYDWGRYWPRWSEAQREAGFEPNQLNPAFSREHLMEQLVALIRELGRFPTIPEMRVHREMDPGFPAERVITRRLGGKAGAVEAVLAYCSNKPGYEDVVEICEPLLAADDGGSPADTGRDTTTYGFVYLARGRRGEYKIGRTSLVDRRVAQLEVGSPVPLVLVHDIKTDDPAGVEAYWHRRFEQRRMRGEWFKLTRPEVSAFKRWKRIA